MTGFTHSTLCERTLLLVFLFGFKERERVVPYKEQTQAIKQIKLRLLWYLPKHERLVHTKDPDPR